MAYGLQIKNAVTGSVQIDETYRNLAFKQKGTLTLSSSPGGSPQAGIGTPGSNGVFAITASGADFVNPVIVFYSPNTHIALIKRRLVNATTFHIQVVAYGSDAPNKTFQYFLFDVPPAPSGTGYGLRVMDSAGNLTFDSNLKYMKVLNPTTTWVYDTGSSTHILANGAPFDSKQNIETHKVYTHTFPSSGTYGFMFNRAGYKIDRVDNYYTSWHFEAKNTSGTTIESWYLPGFQFNPVGSSWPAVTPDISFVDLAGL